jgi:hypothetical protein
VPLGLRVAFRRKGGAESCGAARLTPIAVKQQKSAIAIIRAYAILR